jgi:hypothetical protein
MGFMRLLALALLLLAVRPAQEPPQADRLWKRAFILVNRLDEPLRAGAQVALKLHRLSEGWVPGHLEVRYQGKPLASCQTSPSVLWFRIPADLPARGRDDRYEIRHAPKPVENRGRDVFEFYENLATADLDRARWTWDRELSTERSGNGLNVTSLPGDRTEHTPCSLVPRVGELDRGFQFDVSVLVATKAAFSFAVKAELDEKTVITDRDRAAAARHIMTLGEDDIEARERALKELVKIGAAAIPQLEESARSKEAERRLRSVAAIDAIYRDNPPNSIAGGFRIPGGTENRVDYFNQLGKSRTYRRSTLPEQGFLSLEFSIARDPDGETAVFMGDRRPEASKKIPGKIARLRLDFWTTQRAELGECFIREVRLRRHVEDMPDVEYGAREPAK